MLNKNVLLKVSKESIKLDNKFNNRFFSKDIFKDISKIKIKNKNIYVVIEGEEVNIKLLKVPKVTKWNLNYLIKNELIFLYGKKADNIFYTYTIWDEDEEEREVLVFCVNSNKLNSIENVIKNNKLKSVKLIQFTIINYLKNKVDDKDYILIFKDEDKIYFLGISNEKLIANRIIENNIGDEFLIDIFNYTIAKMKTFNIKANNVYGINFNKTDVIKYIEHNAYKYINLQNISKNKIIECFSIKRK
ncbi:hypothetical protein IRP63_07460 [Clostridium botulinum]|uniref:Uncharacterized protein n=5 Tax=Clostridium botulinum TaxID=1491 RepID=A0A0A0IQW7_CLOBO|nr:hypothetical protein [Clostridium botulinum]KEI07112.1 hypothetical protein Z952_02425 [Clostridium botulinum C/D str. BKT75002]KEI12189.1 hypothetical protein Z954_06570 [Clostridium botulinum C/D str. BKT2873]KGM96875.1 hypothetical protein Z956_02280 [Clostridium botulinum D str. CCUG 7971]KGN01911.1 hypothetical protein Z955_00495 [Clostridium botulinum C/D str. DC5]KOC48548.1 hypothetical protein ADU88_08030 [Clostridium botulinum]